MNILFACDLDNTLLHSFKHKKDGDLCVEKINGKEQGFISGQTYNLLKDVVNKVNFVPVTTRSIEQYCRIKWLKKTIPIYAATTNGAILLKDYIKDAVWCEQSEAYSKTVYDKLVEMQNLLIFQNRFIKCRIVDEMYLFAYIKDGIDIKKAVAEYRSLTELNVVASGKKIYFFPDKINKGETVRRLREKFNPDLVICAGDSHIDIPMLNNSDMAIVPSASMAEKIINKKIYINNTDSFSEYVLKTVLKIINKY